MKLDIRVLLQEWKTLANQITTVRLLLFWVPGYIVLINPHPTSSWWWALGWFVLIVATDKLDGWVAKRFNQITDLGKILDPLVDKLLVVATLIALSIAYPWLWIVIAITVVREVHVAWLVRQRSYAQGAIDSAIQSGRVKMAAQSAAMTVLLVPLTEPWWMLVQYSFVLIALTLTLTSWHDYARYGKE